MTSKVLAGSSWAMSLNGDEELETTGGRADRAGSDGRLPFTGLSIGMLTMDPDGPSGRRMSPRDWSLLQMALTC